LERTAKKNWSATASGDLGWTKRGRRRDQKRVSRNLKEGSLPPAKLDGWREKGV